MHDHVVHNYFENYHQPDLTLNMFQRKVSY